MALTTNDIPVIACYYRYSSNMQSEDSIEAQRAGCIRYCALNGWIYREDLEYMPNPSIQQSS